MATYKGFPKEWPPIKVNPFEDFELAYRHVRDAFNSVNDLKRILTKTFEDIGPIDVKKDFGAKGDGVTDDTTAFQDAATVSGSNLHIFVPPGDYVITGDIAFTDKNVTLFGAGTGISRLLCQDIAATITFVDNGTTIDAKKFQVFDLAIIKDHTTTSGNGGTAVTAQWKYTGVVSSISHALFSNVSIEGQGTTKFWDTGIKLTDGGCIAFERTRIFNEATLDKSRTAIEIVRDVSSNITQFQFSNCYLRAFISAIRLTHTSATAGAGTVEGIYIVNTEAVSCRSFILDDNTTIGFTVNGVHVSNSHASNSKVGFDFGDVSNLYLFDNNFTYAAGGEPSTPAPLEAAVRANTRIQVAVINGNRFFRNGAVTDAADAIVLPTGANISLLKIEQNSFENWTNAVNQTTGDTADQGKIWIGENFFSGTVAPAGIGFRGQAACLSGVGSFASGDTVPFGHTFTSTPRVVAIHSGTNTSKGMAVSAVTTSQFVINHSDGASPLSIQWIAVG